MPVRPVRSRLASHSGESSIALTPQPVEHGSIDRSSIVFEERTTVTGGLLKGPVCVCVEWQGSSATCCLASMSGFPGGRGNVEIEVELGGSEDIRSVAGGCARGTGSAATEDGASGA